MNGMNEHRDEACSVEMSLARFVVGFDATRVPADVHRVMRWMVMAVTGTAIAGSDEDGVEALRALLLDAGGTPQATTLVFGDRLPAPAAAQFNATMCRALDFCDAMAPGPHIGSSLFPAALAATELVGGCRGIEFMAALAVGAELASRFNLSEAQYDGFDPTGIAVVFAGAAAASRILRLTPEQTLNALALAFNRCGGSFQSHVDGSLGVRFVQGWVAQAGVECALLARRGITGPSRFLTGHYGYAHLYGRGTLDADALAANLGSEWRLHRMVFKKFPSCGVTQGVTELVLQLLTEPAAGRALDVADVAWAQVRLPPYAHRLVGHDFLVGSNTRVNAQFSAAYCVANALVRRSSKLRHFSPEGIQDATVQELLKRVRVVADASMDARGHTAVDLEIGLRDGSALRRGLDLAPGFPGADLDESQHRWRFEDCLAYAPRRPSRGRIDALMSQLARLHELEDVRSLVPNLMT
jgi:2-methylcitrate dehydratase PrpD